MTKHRNDNAMIDDCAASDPILQYHTLILMQIVKYCKTLYTKYFFSSYNELNIIILIFRILYNKIKNN